MELDFFKNELINANDEIDKKISNMRINTLKLYYPELLQDIPARGLLEFKQDNLSAIKYFSEKDKLYFVDNNNEKMFFSPDFFMPIFPGEISSVVYKNNKLYCSLSLSHNFNYDFDYLYLYFYASDNLIDDLFLLELCLQSNVTVFFKINGIEQEFKIDVKAEKIDFLNSFLSVNNLCSSISQLRFLKISGIKIDDFSVLSYINIVFDFKEKSNVYYFDFKLGLNIIPVSNLIDDYAEPLVFNFSQYEYNVFYPCDYTLKPYEILKLSYKENNRDKIVLDYLSLNNDSDIYYQVTDNNNLKFIINNLGNINNKIIYPYVKWTQNIDKAIPANHCFYFYSKSNQGLSIKNMLISPAIRKERIDENFVLDLINIKNSQKINYRYFCALLSLFKLENSVKKVFSKILDVSVDSENKILIFYCEFCDENYVLALNFLCRYLCDLISDLWSCVLTFEVLYEKV